MTARKERRDGARKRSNPPCPVAELAIEAGELVTAINQVDRRHATARVGDYDLERALVDRLQLGREPINLLSGRHAKAAAHSWV